MDKINLLEKLSQFNDYWKPKIVGELNGQHIKLVKLKGEFLWHHHDKEDELFLVLKGTLTIRLKDRDIVLTENEFFIVPRGIEHKPLARKEVHILLFEPVSTMNTGNVQDSRTVSRPVSIIS